MPIDLTFEKSWQQIECNSRTLSKSTGNFQRVVCVVAVSCCGERVCVREKCVVAVSTLSHCNNTHYLKRESVREYSLPRNSEGKKRKATV